MRSENQQLRHEITLLQQKLVEKMRGTAKVLVGGGQFRAPNTGSSPIRPGSLPTMAQSCSGCSALRASFKKAHDLSDQEHKTLSSRIVELERCETEAHMYLNQRDEEITRLQEQLCQTEASAVATKMQLGHQIKELQMLQDELVAEKRRYTLDRERDLVRAETTVGRRQGVTAGTQTGEDLASRVVEQARAENLIQQLRETNWNLLNECQDLRGQLASSKDEELGVRKQAEQDQLALTARMSEIENDLLVSTNEKEMLANKLSKLEHSIADGQYQLSIEKHNSQLEAAKWHDLILAKDKDFSDQATRLCECEVLVARLKTRVADLEAQIRSKDEDAHTEAMRVHFVLDEKLVSIESIRTQLLAVTVERDQAAGTVSGLCFQLDNLRKQLETARAERLTLRQAYGETKALLAAADAEVAAREDVHSRITRTHAAALEKALQSAVRLCVVAPTVNVHLNTNSGASVVACKPSLPEEQLRLVVERDVLPLFATVFVQSQESTGPTGAPMDAWLHTLLRDMQGGLATHLQKIYAATTVS